MKSPIPRTQAVLNYITAVLVTAVAVLLRYALDPLLGDHLALATLYGAIAVSVWRGGHGPAAVSVIMGYVACDLLFMAPRGAISVLEPASAVGFGLYLLSAWLIIVIGRRMRATGQRLEASLASLQEEAAERRAAEHKVASLLQRLSALVDNSPLAVIEWDRDFRVARWSGQAERVFGWCAAEAVGKGVRDLNFVYPGDLPGVEEAISGLHDPVNAFVVSSNRNLTRDGRVITCEWYSSVIHDESGVMVAVLSMVLDVTQRERAAAALQESEDRYRAFIRHSTEGIWRMEFDPPQDVSLPVEEQVELAYSRARFAECNEAIARMYGLSSSRELVGKPLGFTLPPDDPAAREFVATVIRSGYRVVDLESTERDAQGNAVYFSNSMMGVVEGGKLRSMWGIQRDITERKRAEAALRQSESQFRSFFELAAFGAAQYDPRTGRLLSVNDRYCEITGFGREELLSVSFRDLTHADDRDADWAGFQEMVRGRTTEYSNEKRYIRKDGGVVWVFAAARVLRDASGQPVRAAGIVLDITQRRLAEERLIEHRDHLDRLVRERTAELQRSDEALRLAERMVAMGTLSAGLGHDMNNILLPMRVWLDVLDGAPDPAEARHSIRSLRRSTDYLRSLALGLRALSMDPEDAAGAPARTVLAEWWPEVHGLYRAPLPRGVQLHSGGLSGLPPLAIPAHALTQAVFNLIQNAGDALRDRAGGNIWVSAEPENGEIRLAVRDDGPGMTPDVRARCIEPFFTTKPRGRGTGLGLSIVHGILKRYRGRLEVESGPGHGTSLTLIIPQAGTEVASARSAAVDVRDARTQAFVRAVVTRLGMSVEPYSNGAPPGAHLWIADESVATEAIARFLESGGRAVVLGDRPGLSGNVEVVRDPRRPSDVRDALARAAGAASAA